MKATVGDLADHIFNKDRSDEFLFCRSCGSRYSASKGDYWSLPDDYKFECCGEPMTLARELSRIVEV